MTHILIPREPSTALLRPFIGCHPQELPEAYAAMVRIAEVQHARDGRQCLAQIEEPAKPARIVLDDNWKARMLDGRAPERDEMGLGDHPELPWLDEGMMPRSFFAALGLELAHTSAEDQLDGDVLGAMSEAVNWSRWMPTAPQGDGWKLVSIFDTEDGPVAWWLRELPEAEDGTTTIRTLQAEVEKLKARIARAGAAPAAVAPQGEYPHEQMDAMALARYKVVPSHASMLWSHAVVAGDGAQQLYVGREVECQNMARKFAGAFLDGAFAFHSMAAAPTAQAAPEAPAPESAPWCPDVCPITGRPFFMWIDHWQTGKPVPTYGGPYDSYTIPVKDSDGSFECERYDHDEGGWLTEGAGWHCLGVKLVNDQSFVVAPEHPRYDEIEAFAAAAPQAPAAPVEFQQRVQPWMMACFGTEIAADRAERNHRFLEEALELVQACGCTASEAHQLVDYVYGRPVGEPAQEVGGVMVTLAALCLANSLDMHAAGETELARIWGKVEQIRAKQAAKPKHSPLPAAPAAPAVDAAGDTALLDAMERERIAVIPEFEGPWDAQIFGEDEATLACGSGVTPRKAIAEALASLEARKAHDAARAAAKGSGKQ